MRWLMMTGFAILLASPVQAQSEDDLKRFFEGKSVVVKIDLPATEDGVDVFPELSAPLDYSRYATRLKRTGTAVRVGESIIVTKIRVKESHVEFQLGGGGYGTFGDDDGTHVNVPAASKTERERNLERDLKTERDANKRRGMQEELDGLRKDRQREDARNRAYAADAEESKKANVRARAVEAGSRFNVRFQAPVGSRELMPQSIMDALAKYVDFPESQFGGGPSPVARAASSGQGSLRKGATRDEIESALGKPTAVSERMEGQLKVVTSVYQTDWGKVEAQFVEGVLIRYSVSSNE